MAATTVFLSGCIAAVGFGAMGASNTANANDEKLAAKTAEYFGAKPSEIKITNIHNQLFTTAYQATYKGVLYNCDTSSMVAVLTCLRPGGQPFSH